MKKPENNEPRPKFTGSYKKKKRVQPPRKNRGEAGGGGGGEGIQGVLSSSRIILKMQKSLKRNLQLFQTKLGLDTSFRIFFEIFRRFRKFEEI